MNLNTVCSLFGLFLLNIFSIVSTAPCFTIQRGPVYYTVTVCSCWRRGWWRGRYCTHYRGVTRVRYRYVKRCCSGYTGSDCSIPICSCQNGGVCVAPNLCRCPSGYEGNSCQTPRCNPQCRHGYCSSPNRCTCYGGYSGIDCSTRMKYSKTRL